jgi:hypothetical protein
LAAADRTGADLIASDFARFFPDGSEHIEEPRLPEGWSHLKAISGFRWGCLPSAVMVRKSALEVAGGFDTRQRFNEDNDMWRRILKQGGTVHHVEEVLTRYRCGHTAMTSPRNAFIRVVYDLRLSAKVLLDTPRSELPPLWSLLPTGPAMKLLTALFTMLIPKLLRQPFHPDRLRRRWRALKKWRLHGHLCE